MTENEVLRKLQPIFREVFDNAELVVTRATSAFDIADWDSLAQINLIVAMEKMFAVKFSLQELQALGNVGDMVDLICAKGHR